MAGAAIREIRDRSVLTITTKTDLSPVTEADRTADRLLRAALTVIEPAAWLSEESADDQRRLQHSRLWVVDPLDGTKEFIANIAEYAIAVALVEDGQPVLAAVHNPASGEMYTAVRGGGAYRGGQRISVAEGAVLLASRSEVSQGEFVPFENGEWTIRSTGSIALKLARVAAGDAAVTLSRGPKWEWDVCAGVLLVTEAGGRSTDMFGAPMRFNRAFPKVPGILAGAPLAHAHALDLLREVGETARMRAMRRDSR